MTTRGNPEVRRRTFGLAKPRRLRPCCLAGRQIGCRPSEWLGSDAWLIGGNVKGYLLTGRIQPLLFVGANFMEATVGGGGVGHTSESGFAARFGAGVDFYATACEAGSPCHLLSLDASYVLPTGDVEDANFISLGWGFQIRF